MSITTKIGDKRTTRLLSGEEVAKDDLRLETYGTLDELVAHLGIARSLMEPGSLADDIRALQVELFRLGSELATPNPEKSEWVEATTEAHVRAMERRMQEIEKSITLPASFLVPGTSPPSAALEVARTAGRRLEGRAIALAKTGGYTNQQGLILINRLSDYCFLLAREVEVRQGIPFDAKDV